MSAMITILSDLSSVYGAEHIELPLKNLCIEFKTVHTFEEVDPQSDLVIVLHAEKQGEAFNTYALKNGLTWLPVQFSHTVGRMGPIMIPEVSACYECLQLRCASNGVAPLTPKETTFELSWSLISGIVAMETIKWVSRNTNSFAPLSLGHLIEFDAFYLQGDVNPVYKLPTCPSCGVRKEPHLAAQPWHESDLVHQP